MKSRRSEPWPVSRSVQTSIAKTSARMQEATRRSWASSAGTVWRDGMGTGSTRSISLPAVMLALHANIADQCEERRLDCALRGRGVSSVNCGLAGWTGLPAAMHPEPLRGVLADDL